jgi:hypothetical protein
MNVKDFLADRTVRANRREADEPSARTAEVVIMVLAVVCAFWVALLS